MNKLHFYEIKRNGESGLLTTQTRYVSQKFDLHLNNCEKQMLPQSITIKQLRDGIDKFPPYLTFVWEDTKYFTLYQCVLFFADYNEYTAIRNRIQQFPITIFGTAHLKWRWVDEMSEEELLRII